MLSVPEIDRLLSYAGMRYYKPKSVEILRRYPLDRNPVTKFVEAVEANNKSAEGWDPSILAEERLVFGFHESFGECARKLSDLGAFRALRCDEDCNFHVDNAFMEYFCGFRRIEEIVISDTEHHLTGLPFLYMSSLRILFICQDKQIEIMDADLKLMPKLEIIELSYNSTITDDGILCCPNLREVRLHNNRLLTRRLLEERPGMVLDTLAVNSPGD